MEAPQPPYADQVWTMVAAFFGSCLSLAYLRGVKPFDALTAIGSGVLSAVYLGGPAMQYFQLSGAPANRALGFGIGLFAMSVLGGLFVWLEQWRANPTSILKTLSWWRR